MRNNKNNHFIFSRRDKAQRQGSFQKFVASNRLNEQK